jgi:hypothetical protein
MDRVFRIERDQRSQADGGTTDITRPNCERTEARHCKLRELSAAEWARVGEIISRMTTHTDYCAGAKRIAESMQGQGIAGGGIQLWDNRDLYINSKGRERMYWGRNLADGNGRFLAFDSYVVFSEPYVVAHEALHAYLSSINSPLLGDDNEAWVDEHQHECAG